MAGDGDGAPTPTPFSPPHSSPSIHPNRRHCIETISGACQMLTLNCFSATVHGGSRQCPRKLVHYRRLQHSKSSGASASQHCVVPLPSNNTPLSPKYANTNAMLPKCCNTSIFRSKSSMMRQQHFVTSFNERNCHGHDHDHDDHRSDPEYMEIVNQTAENMRSAVRKYIAQISHQQQHESIMQGKNVERLGMYGREILMDHEHQADHHLYPIKLVGILATNNTCRTNHIGAPPTSSHLISSNSFHTKYDDDTHGNEQYSEHIANCCGRDGIVYETWRVPPSRTSLEYAIEEANTRQDVHGVLIFYPLVDKLIDDDITTSDRIYKNQEMGVYYRTIDDYFRDLVDCGKDVEGYCRSRLRMQKPHNMEDINEEDFAEEIMKAETVVGPIHPCTALAVYKVLESLQSSDDGSRPYEQTTMTIINRSEVLGLPLAIMLSSQGATVYSIDKDSILVFLPNGKVRREDAATMEQCVRDSSVIISGVPSSAFKVPTDWIATNATVINVAAESNFDEETLSNGYRGIKYVPHVGRVTVAALEYNLMRLHRQAQMFSSRIE